MMYIVYTATVITLLVLWFKTEAVVEYFNMSSVVKKYLADRDSNPELTFIGYLGFRYNNFFTRLIACHYCLCVWLVLPIVFFAPVYYFPIVYIASLVIYNLV